MWCRDFFITHIRAFYYCTVCIAGTDMEESKIAARFEEMTQRTNTENWKQIFPGKE
jgi:hypothetical protein